MNKDTLSMINQILMDEESLDQLREKLDHEKKQCFPKEKPCKPEREQVTRCYNPVKSQLKPDYAKWCRPLIFTGIQGRNTELENVSGSLLRILINMIKILYRSGRMLK